MDCGGICWVCVGESEQEQELITKNPVRRYLALAIFAILQSTGKRRGNSPRKPKQEEGEEQLTCHRMTIGSAMHVKLDFDPIDEKIKSKRGENRLRDLAMVLEEGEWSENR